MTQARKKTSKIRQSSVEATLESGEEKWRRYSGEAEKEKPPETKQNHEVTTKCDSVFESKRDFRRQKKSEQAKPQSSNFLGPSFAKY